MKNIMLAMVILVAFCLPVMAETISVINKEGGVSRGVEPLTEVQQKAVNSPGTEVLNLKLSRVESNGLWRTVVYEYQAYVYAYGNIKMVRSGEKRDEKTFALYAFFAWTSIIFMVGAGINLLSGPSLQENKWAKIFIHFSFLAIVIALCTFSTIAITYFINVFHIGTDNTVSVLFNIIGGIVLNAFALLLNRVLLDKLKEGAENVDDKTCTIVTPFIFCAVEFWFISMF